MNLVDSCGWLEYFANGPNAGEYAKPIESSKPLIVPAICVYEVFKRILQQRDEHSALTAAALMSQRPVIAMDAPLAMSAAKLGATLNLPIADSVILATARSHDALLWTSDTDFKGLPGVKLIERKPASR